jgi:hypothetical protein
MNKARESFDGQFAQTYRESQVFAKASFDKGFIMP